MLASFLLPTRKRPVKLARAVSSICDTADYPSQVEVCLRVHSDDTETIRSLPSLLAMGNVRVHIGPPLSWAGQVQVFNEAQRISTGKWVWLFNDDCVLEGKGWDTQLSQIPVGQIAIPETHRLGQSTYRHDLHIPMFAMPNVAPGQQWFPNDGDVGLWEKYRDFDPHWLVGISVWHDRNEQDCKRIREV